MKFINYQKLKKFSYLCFLKKGLKKKHAQIISACLCETSLRGIDSHGINLLRHYLNSAGKRKKINPNLRFKKKYNSIYQLDADNAFGHVSSYYGIEKSILLAKKNGIGMVCIKNSSHLGALSSNMNNFSKLGYIIIGMTNADSLLQTYNSKNSFFGTNPIAVSVPRKNMHPFCLDMSTSIISWNKLLNFKNSKKKLHGNFAFDKLGNATNDPSKALGLVPFGDYKGFGLAAVVEIFCSIINGLKFGDKITKMYSDNIYKKRNLGHLFMAIKININISKKKFLEEMTMMSKKVYQQQQKSKKNEIFLPGDKENKTSEMRLKKGIPVSKSVLFDLITISKELKINFNA